MGSSGLDGMRARARAVRRRASIRGWEYRQRHLAAGVWFRLRRLLAGAKAAYVVSIEDARRLVADGYRPEACGAQISPEKILLFVDAARLARVESRREIPVGLGPEFLMAPAVVLVAFDEQGHRA